MLVWLGGQNVIFEKVGAKMWFVEFWGQDVILGEFGIEMWFWESLGSKCNFRRIWGWNVILGSKCNFGSLWVFFAIYGRCGLVGFWFWAWIKCEYECEALFILRLGFGLGCEESGFNGYRFGLGLLNELKCWVWEWALRIRIGPDGLKILFMTRG